MIGRHIAAGTASFLLFCMTAAAQDAIELRDCSAGSPPPRSVIAALDQFLSDSIDPNSKFGRDGLLAPGAVMLVRTPDWFYFKATGSADPTSGTPLDCAMPYEIGSATKMMTGTVLMQLQEESRLSLDDRLADHLPGIAARLPFGEKITLRQLATHTSGIFSYTDNAADGTPGIMEGALADPALLTVSRTPDELIGFAIDHGTPTFEPGADEQWAYSNTGYILIGMILEKIEGRPLAETFRARLFAPAAMTETFFWNDVPAPEFGLPRAWYKAPFEFEATRWNLSQGWAAGGVISTAQDMARFVETLLAGGFFKHADTLGAMQAGVKAPFPHVSYGIGLAEKTGGFFGHGGQTMGFESDAGRNPADGTTIIFWTNSANNAAALGLPLISAALAGALEQ